MEGISVGSLLRISLLNRLFILATILLTATIIFSGMVLAQAPNRMPPTLAAIDQQTELISDPDSVANLYLIYSRSVSHTNPQQIGEVQRRLETIEGLDDKKKTALQSEMQAHYFQISEVDSSLYYYNIASDYYEQVLNYEAYVFVRTRMARLYSRKNDFISAEEVYYDLLQKIEALELDEPIIQNLRNEMAGLYVRVGAIDLAISQYETTLADASASNDLRCRVLLQVSNAYKRNKQINEAIDVLQECTTLLEQSEDKRVILPLQVAIWRSISDLLEEIGDQEGQLEMALLAYNTEKRRGRSSFPTMTTLLSAYLSNNRLEDAGPLFQEMEAVPARMIQQPNRAIYFVYQADYLNRIGEFNRALEVIDEALSYVENLPLNGGGIRTQILFQQAISYESLGRLEDALNIMKDLNSLERQNALSLAIQEENLAKVRFQIREKNNQIDQISDQLTRTQVASLIFLFIFVGGLAFLVYRNKKETELEVNKARVRISEDLHDDLSASLNSISFYAESLIEGKVSGGADRVIRQIADISTQSSERIADIIWATQTNSNTLGNISAKCKRYVLDLFENHEIELDVEVDSESSMVLTSDQNYDLWLIYKEILNNIVKHAHATKVDIRLVFQKNTLKLRVQDNGTGFDRNSLDRVFGITNIESRVHRLGGESLLNSEPGKGTSWEISIPLKT